MQCKVSFFKVDLFMAIFKTCIRECGKGFRGFSGFGRLNEFLFWFDLASIHSLKAMLFLVSTVTLNVLLVIFDFHRIF